jgi:hypothetical protein
MLIRALNGSQHDPQGAARLRSKDEKPLGVRTKRALYVPQPHTFRRKIMSAFDVFAIVLIIGGTAIVLSTVISHTLKFSVQVEPLIEWVVIRSLDGEIRALGAGTHSLQPGWKEVDRVPTSIQEFSETGEEVRTQNSIRLALSARLNFVAGRKMTPALVGPPPDWFDIDNASAVVTESMVIRASTSIDPGKPTRVASIREQVKLAVDAACEEVFGCYSDEELLGPDVKKPWVPTNSIPGMARKKAKSTSELFPLLSEYIRRVANRSLEKIGVGVISITITNLRYLDQKLQDATESKRRKIMLVQTAQEVKSRLTELSDHASLLVGDTEFATLTAAEAEAQGRIEAARAMRDGMTNLANAAKDLKGIITINTK